MRTWRRGLLFLMISAAPFGAAADSCEPVKDWLALVSAPLAPTPEERDAAAQTEWTARSTAAQRIYKMYIDGSDLKNLDACIPNLSNRTDLYSAVFAAFRTETLSFLARSKQPTIRRLVQLVQERNNRGQLISRRLTGHVFGPPPVDLRAGYQGATGVTFLDISRISANEWPVIFAHEMLHGLDEDLYDSVKIQSEEWRWSLYKSADSKDQQEFRRWIEASLSLGLWAEYRAWYFTLKIYKEGLSEDLWKPIAWLDESFPPKDDLKRTVYEGLDRNFKDPTEGFFSNPEVNAALKRARESVRRPNSPPPLGYLAQAFGEPTK